MKNDVPRVGLKPHLPLIVGVLVVLIGTIVLAVQAHHKIQHNMGRHQHIDAFDSYMKVLPGFLYQHKPYTSERFPLPPFAMLFVAPYTHLSRPNAQAAWVLTKAVMIIGIFMLALSIVRRAGGDVPLPALLLVCAGWFFPVIGDVQEGQMNLLMLLPLAAGLWMAQVETGWADAAAGLLVAMAICIKVTPLAFVAFFVYRRRWRITAWLLAGIGWWLFAVPAVVFSWRQNIAWLGQWSHMMLKPYLVHGAVKFSNGESIPEFVKRLLSHSPAWVNKPHGLTEPHYINIVNLSSGAVEWISRGILLLLAVGGAWWARRAMPSFRCRRYVMEIACVGAFMLWASERTWVPHYVTLIFALMAVGMIAADAEASPAARGRAWGALGLTAFFMLWTSDIAKVLGHNGRHYVNVFDVVLWSSLALVLAMMFSGYLPAVADRVWDGKAIKPKATGNNIGEVIHGS